MGEGVGQKDRPLCILDTSASCPFGRPIRRRQTIHEHAPKDHASKQYLALTDEVLVKLGIPASVAPTKEASNDAAGVMSAAVKTVGEE